MVDQPSFRHTGKMSVSGPIQFEEISPDDCLILLELAYIGRVGVSVQALPVILPVNYVMHEGDVVFRTGAGTKLAAATAGAVVAFEVDHHDPHGTRGWSVLLQGRAEEVVDPERVAQAATLPLHSWALDGAADHFVRLRPTMISGRRFQTAGLAEGPDETINKGELVGP
jgi:nitroimidazol reductase NimA-like FMN-containing flavoprotein (pyridoxamine 5'-phosphate oxidase superfamily)